MAKKASELLKEKAKAISKIVKDTFPSNVMQQFADNIADQIRKRTRLGYGVTSGGKQVRLKALKESTIAQRSKYKKNLSELTKPKRSNLTATGQMLDAIKGKGLTARVEIQIKPNNRNKELSGSKSSSTNIQILTYVSKLRPFFALTTPEVSRFTRELKAILKEATKKAFK